MRFTASNLVLSAALVGCVLAQPNNVLRGTKREAEISFGGQISAPVELDDVVAAPAANATAAGDDKWYLVDKVKGLHPKNARFKDDKNFYLLVKPDQEAVRVRSKAYYKGGKFEFKVRSAAAAPGIITSVYLASGLGRKSDQETGKQDEIDLEWKGNNATFVQTNVFLTGQEDLKLIDLKIPSNSTMRLYGLEWNDQAVNFYIDGQVVRSKTLDRPLKPMQLQMSVWTTMGGWPGLIQWAGPMYWNATEVKSANATFELVSFPDEATDMPKDLDDGAADAVPDDDDAKPKPAADDATAKPAPKATDDDAAAAKPAPKATADDAAAAKPAPKATADDAAAAKPAPKADDATATKPKPAADSDGVATDIDTPKAGGDADAPAPTAGAPAPADDSKPNKGL